MLASFGAIVGISLQTYKVVTLAMNVTNSTSPAGGIVNGSRLIIDICSPPVIKYPLKCVVLLAQIGVAPTTGGPVGAAIAISAAR